MRAFRSLVSILVILLSVFTAANAQAYGTCSSLFSNSKTSSAAEELVQNFKSLHGRMLKNDNSGSFDAATSFKTILTESERIVFAKSNLNILRDIIKRGIPVIKSLRTEKFLQSEITISQEQAKSLYTTLENYLKAGEQAISYEQMAEVSLRITLLAEDVHQGFTRRMNLNYKGDTRIRKDTADRLRNILQMSLFPLITDKALNIRDFNDLFGSGIVPIGMTSHAIRVDGELKTPLKFFDHDFGHANIIRNAMLNSKNINWPRLISTIDTWSKTDQAAAHVVIFILTHEVVFEKKENFFTTEAWMGHEFVRILREQDFLGEAALSSVENLEGYLLKIMNRLGDLSI